MLQDYFSSINTPLLGSGWVFEYLFEAPPDIHWALLTLTYFIAKFFEARADLISAMVIGKPKLLADALEKIGFQRLLYERVPAFRVQEWLSMDPHPSIYFRIARAKSTRTLCDKASSD